MASTAVPFQRSRIVLQDSITVISTTSSAPSTRTTLWSSHGHANRSRSSTSSASIQILATGSASTKLPLPLSTTVAVKSMSEKSDRRGSSSTSLSHAGLSPSAATMVAKVKAKVAANTHTSSPCRRQATPRANSSQPRGAGEPHPYGFSCPEAVQMYEGILEQSADAATMSPLPLADQLQHEELPVTVVRRHVALLREDFEGDCSDSVSNSLTYASVPRSSSPLEVGLIKMIPPPPPVSPADIGVAAPPPPPLPMPPGSEGSSSPYARQVLFGYECAEYSGSEEEGEEVESQHHSGGPAPVLGTPSPRIAMASKVREGQFPRSYGSVTPQPPSAVPQPPQGRSASGSQGLAEDEDAPVLCESAVYPGLKDPSFSRSTSSSSSPLASSCSFSSPPMLSGDSVEPEPQPLVVDTHFIQLELDPRLSVSPSREVSAFTAAPAPASLEGLSTRPLTPSSAACASSSPRPPPSSVEVVEAVCPSFSPGFLSSHRNVLLSAYRSILEHLVHEHRQALVVVMGTLYEEWWTRRCPIGKVGKRDFQNFAVADVALPSASGFASEGLLSTMGLRSSTASPSPWLTPSAVESPLMRSPLALLASAQISRRCVNLVDPMAVQLQSGPCSGIESIFRMSPLASTRSQLQLWDTYVEFQLGVYERQVQHLMFDFLYTRMVAVPATVLLERQARRIICMKRDLYLRDMIELFMLASPAASNGERDLRRVKKRIDQLVGAYWQSKRMNSCSGEFVASQSYRRTKRQWRYLEEHPASSRSKSRSHGATAETNRSHRRTTRSSSAVCMLSTTLRSGNETVVSSSQAHCRTTPHRSSGAKVELPTIKKRTLKATERKFPRLRARTPPGPIREEFFASLNNLECPR